MVSWRDAIECAAVEGGTTRLRNRGLVVAVVGTIGIWSLTRTVVEA